MMLPRSSDLTVVLKSPINPKTETLRLYSRRSAAVCVFIWVAFLIWLAPMAWRFSHQIQGTLTGVQDSPAEQVRARLVDNFSTALAFPTAIVWDAKGMPKEESDAKWKALFAAADGDDKPEVLGNIFDAQTLVQPWPRPDWYVAFVELRATDYASAEQALPPLREFLATQGNFPADNPVAVTGGPALFRDLNEASTRGLREAEMMALPITFIILVLVFRSVVAAFLPVLVAGLGVIMTLGLLSYTAKFWPVTFFVPNLVSMIGLGVGIDYCLIYLSRYRRERSQHLTTREALQITRQTAGHTVLASAVLVMSGFVALMVIPLQFFHSIAVGGILVVGTVAAATLTLLPALILLLGSALEWGQVRKEDSKFTQKVRNIYHRWARFLLDHPWVCFIGGSAALLVIASPVLRLHVTSIQAETLPKWSEARRGYLELSKELGAGWLMPTIILAKHKDREWLMSEDERLQENELVAAISKMPNTNRVVSVLSTSSTPRARKAKMEMLTGSQDGSESLILAMTSTDPQSNESRRWLHELDHVIKDHMAKFPNGPKYTVGGVAATTTATDEVIFAALPKVILATLVTTFILLMLYMKSIFVPLKAIVLNLLCVLAAYGFAVLWFQDGHGAGIMSFVKTDGVNTIVMVICFCALFGLSMDYEVFILSSVREVWLDSHDMGLAIEEGLQRTAGIITSAALIMVSVFLCFAFGAVVETQQLGLSLSFAVLLDATLIRLVLVPSSMALMGEWNWWLPGRRVGRAPEAPEAPRERARRKTHSG